MGIYGASIWSVSKEVKRRMGVCFNWTVRRTFRYHDFESIKHILFGYKYRNIETR